HVKFIHDQQIAKKIIRYVASPSPRRPAVTVSCRDVAAMLTAMTKTRSKNSSSELAARPLSAGSRGRIGTSRNLFGLTSALLTSAPRPERDRKSTRQNSSHV